jgi:hypothetical protein
MMRWILILAFSGETWSCERHTFQSSDSNTTRRFDSSAAAGCHLHATIHYPRLVSLHDSSWHVAPGITSSGIPPDLEEGKVRMRGPWSGVQPRPHLHFSASVSNPTDDMRFLYFLEKIPIASFKRDFPMSLVLGASLLYTQH